MISAFHFRVLFPGLKGITEIDTRFESVNGIQGAINKKETGSSGSNNENSLATLFQPVVLRRAVLSPENSILLQWVINCLNKSLYDPQPEVLIEVLNEEHLPLVIIKLREVSVKSWSLGELHAQKSNILMEELQLEYKSLEMIGTM